MLLAFCIGTFFGWGFVWRRCKVDPELNEHASEGSVLIVVCLFGLMGLAVHFGLIMGGIYDGQ